MGFGEILVKDLQNSNGKYKAELYFPRKWHLKPKNHMDRDNDYQDIAEHVERLGYQEEESKVDTFPWRTEDVP